MFGPTSVNFNDSFTKIVYEINLNSVMVRELNYHLNENVYIKPKMNIGLVDKPYMCLTSAHGYGERQ